MSESDPPQSFGYKTSWVAVPKCEPLLLAHGLGMTKTAATSWLVGMERAYDLQGVFIPPAIGAWTIAVGAIPSIDESAWQPMMESLGRAFGSAFYFGTHRVVGYQAWGRAQRAGVVRAFGYLGESGEYLCNVGPRTAEEIGLDLGAPDDDRSPDEEDVLNLAAKWVFDPRTLEEMGGIDGPGIFARA
jgi:hypothetical protein